MFSDTITQKEVIVTTVGERIKYIRKDLKMTQESFGNSFGVSRDVVNNMERDRVEIKDYMLRLICKTHRVNYYWLTEEKGEPYLGPPSILLNDVIEEYHLDEMDREIIEEYIKLDPEMRNAIKQLIRNIVKKAPD